MNVQFYRIEVVGAEEGTQFEDLIDTVKRQSDLESRVRYMDGWPYRLERAEGGKGAKRVTGDMMRMQFYNFPPALTMRTPSVRLPLKKGQGIGNSAAFLYDPKTQIIALQSNLQMHIQKVCRYFASGWTDDFLNVEFYPVFDEEHMRVMRSLTSATSVTFKAAVPDDPSFFRGKSKIVEDIMDIGKRTDAPEISVGVTVGQQWRKKSLQWLRLEKAIDVLLGHGSEYTKSIQVTGYDDDAVKHSLELVKGRLAYHENLVVNEDHGTYEGRVAILQNAWNEHADYLKNYIRRFDD